LRFSKQFGALLLVSNLLAVYGAFGIWINELFFGFGGGGGLLFSSLLLFLPLIGLCLAVGAFFAWSHNRGSSTMVMICSSIVWLYTF
jgi:hypothetical protein